MRETLISALLGVQLSCNELLDRLAEGVNEMSFGGDTTIVFGIAVDREHPCFLVYGKGTFERISDFSAQGKASACLRDSEGVQLGTYRAEGDQHYIAIPVLDVMQAYSLEILFS